MKNILYTYNIAPFRSMYISLSMCCNYACIVSISLHPHIPKFTRLHRKELKEWQDDAIRFDNNGLAVACFCLRSNILIWYTGIIHINHISSHGSCSFQRNVLWLPYSSGDAISMNSVAYLIRPNYSNGTVEIEGLNLSLKKQFVFLALWTSTCCLMTFLVRSGF